MNSFAAVNVSLGGAPAFFVIFLLLTVLFAAILLVLSPAIIATGRLRKKAEDISRAYDRTVIAQYDPPQGLTPAEVGFLYDMKCDDKEILATLLDLAARKVIQLDATLAVNVPSAETYENLHSYEKIAIQLHNKNQLFVTEDARRLQLQAATASNPEVTYVALPAPTNKIQFTAAVQQSLRAKGYKLKSYTGSFVLRILLLALLVGCWPLITASFSTNFNGTVYPGWSWPSVESALGLALILGIFLFPLYVGFAYLALRLWVRFAGRAWLNTKQVRDVWPELEGYRLFLKQVDYSGVQPSVPEGVINKTVPYGVVFDLPTDWQRRLSNSRSPEVPS